MAGRTSGKSGRGVAIAVGAATFAVVAGAVASIKRLFDPHIVMGALGGPALVFTIEDESGERVRMLGNRRALQSGTYLGPRRWDLPFEYYRAFDEALADDLPRSSDGMLDVLMLGGGGFAWPKHALHDNDDVRVDVVELDPVITEVAHRWFFLDELEDELHVKREGRLRIFTMDAAAYLRGCSTRYAAIINDAFAGAHPVESLIEPETLGNIKRSLLDGGIYVVNVPEHAGRDERLNWVADRLKSVFAHVRIVSCTDREFSDDDNYLVIGTDA